MPKGGITHWLWDALFPQFCLMCEQEGDLLCTVCGAAIAVPGLFLAVNENGLGSVRSLAKYETDSGVGKLIEHLKYQYAAAAASAVQRLAYRWCRQNTPLARPDLVVPIPLHRRRLAERGFNQAAIIAAAVAIGFGVPLREDIIVRRRATKQQAKLDRVGRLHNMHNAFAVKKPTQVMGRQIWLIDDVYTTGSTMQAAAKVLANAGAHVNGLTLARG